jgi:ribonuclease D
MLEYAAADTRFLLPLRDLLRERLRERGRLSWAEEEFALLSTTDRSPSDPEQPSFLRIKGARALNRRGLAILRELAQWREDLARRTDRAAFRILSNEPMLVLAKDPPRDLGALRQVKGVGQDLFERRGKEIFGALERGLAVPESELPRLQRAIRIPPDGAYDARLERLKALRGRLAERYQLAPGVLCPNGTLEIIARRNPATLEQLSEIRELRRWQLGELGPELLAALRNHGDQSL